MVTPKQQMAQAIRALAINLSMLLALLPGAYPTLAAAVTDLYKIAQDME